MLILHEVADANGERHHRRDSARKVGTFLIGLVFPFRMSDEYRFRKILTDGLTLLLRQDIAHVIRRDIIGRRCLTLRYKTLLDAVNELVVDRTLLEVEKGTESAAITFTLLAVVLLDFNTVDTGRDEDAGNDLLSLTFGEIDVTCADIGAKVDRKSVTSHVFYV